MADVDGPAGSLLTCEDLRRVLDQFARETFREEFSELRSQVLEEIKKEFQGLQRQNGCFGNLPDQPSKLRFTAAGNSVIIPPSPEPLFTPASDEPPKASKKRGVTWADAPEEKTAANRDSEISEDGHRASMSLLAKSQRALVKSKTQMKSLDSLKIEAQKKASQQRKKKLTMVESRTTSYINTDSLNMDSADRSSKQSGKVTRKNFARSASRLAPSRRGSKTWTFCSKRYDNAASIGEAIIIIFIILNGFFIGIQTDYHARVFTEEVPTVFEVMEIVFCVVFTTELIIKLGKHRHKFFCMTGWMWNVFDTFLVVVQLIEVVGNLAEGDKDSQGVKFSFVRLLRILRLFRILRLVRLLQFIDELAVIISSIGRSFLSLCWTVFLLLILMYMVGVVFCQIVFTHRVNTPSDESELDMYWGSVPRSVLTLYQATMGGIDWGQTMTPLEVEISPVLSVAFCLYIAFVLLAVMNVITGTFVQSAVKDAEKDKIQDFLYAANRAFSRSANSNGFRNSNQQVCPEQVTFEHFAQMVEGELAGWLASMNIKQEDAKLIFYLLDKKQDQRVQTNDLIESLCRLREGAQFMDIMKVMYEYERQSEAFEDLLNDMAEIVVQEINPETSKPHRGSAYVPARSMTGSLSSYGSIDSYNKAPGSYRAFGSIEEEVLDVDAPKTPPGNAAQLQPIHPFGANYYSSDNPNESEWEIEEV